MAITFTETTTLVKEECISCGIVFSMPITLQNKCQNDPSKPFYCPNGHQMVYKFSKEEKARKEAEEKLRLAQQKLDAEYVKSIQLESQLKKEQNKLKRLTNGVCPCCNRSFHNLQQHMKKQHPEEISKAR